VAVFPVLTADGSTILANGFAVVVTGTPTPPPPMGDSSILITDFVVTTAAVLGLPSGAWSGTLELEPSDFGVILPNQIFAIFDDGTKETVLYQAPAGTELFRVGPFGSTLANINSDRAHTFYVGTTVGSSVATIHTVSDAGIVGGTVWTLPNTSKSLLGMAPDRANTILYYGSLTTGGGGTRSVVYRYDLVNSIAMTNLVAALTNYNTTKDIFVLNDGTILVGYHSTIFGQQEKIVRYNTDGTMNQTYLIGLRDDYSLNRFAPNTDESTIWVWIQNGPNNPAQPVHFSEIRLSDGVTTNSFAITEAGSQGNPALHEISNSCPVIVLGGTTPPMPGTTFPIRRLRRFAL